MRSGWERPAAAPARRDLRLPLPPGGTVRWEIPFSIPPDARPHLPADRHLRDGADRPAWVEVEAAVRVGDSGTAFPVRARRRISVRPPLEIRLDPWSLFLRPTDIARVLPVLLENHAGTAFRGPFSVTVEGTDRLGVTAPATVSVGPGEEVLVPVRIFPREGLAEGAYSVTVRAGDALFGAPFRVVDVGIPEEVKVAVVATLSGAERRALEMMGIRPDVLDDRQLRTADLGGYDAIVLGARAYGVRPVLRRMNRRLLDYVAGGGNLLVMGNRAEDWDPAFAPYRLVLGKERVSRERAPLRFVEEKHRLLSFPNRIRPDDFLGWVQERGRDFPEEWDTARYRVLLATGDPGRPEVPALLVAPFGKGTWMMTSLAWYRQLAIFNPAALRFLANAVSYSWRKY